MTDNETSWPIRPRNPEGAKPMTLEQLIAEYRPTMDREVLHAWAHDVVAAIDQLRTGQLVTVADDAIERVKAEARDKALDEAAGACETHMKQFLDDNDVRKMWPATQARNDVYAGIIRALKSPKPQEATMSEGVGG